MKKLIVFPSESIRSYLAVGQDYATISRYFNPAGFFDEVYCVSPWGDRKEDKIDGITYIKANPLFFKRIIKEINPSVVRAYGGYHCADWAAISKVDDIPTVVSLHDTNKNIMFKSITFADAVICTAECVKNAFLEKYRYEEERIYIKPNWVNLQRFHRVSDDDEYLIKLKNTYGDGKHILHVGRKSEQKNLDTLIKAMRYVDADCIFVGRGDTDKYIKMAKEYGVDSKCIFIDSVPNDELKFYYTWCDCMCTPSRWEGFGIVFIEAEACESIVITSNIPPMNEYLVNNQNAILIDDYENDQKLASILNNVLNNTEKYSDMRSKARIMAEKFDQGKIDILEADIYDRIIQKGSKNKHCNNLITFYKSWKCL